MNWDEIQDAPDFSFKGKEIQAKVISVYDGDTIKVIFPLNENDKTLYKWNCRLSRVDTPELRTRCKIEKEYGYKVRDILRNRILNKIVNLKCGDFDKYGRLLIEILCKEEDNLINTDNNTDNFININDWLISNNYAFEYNGGTKKKWSDFLLNKNNE